MDDIITPIGLTNFRNKKTRFGIKLDDRRRHTYVVGKTGSGKTTLLEHMVISDMRAGHGVGVVDPHGEFAEKMLDFVPEERTSDVVYFNPADMEYPIAFNPMEQVGEEFRHLVASGLMGVFKKMWPDAWSARMEYILNNTLLALLELPDSTLLSIMRMFAEPNYRKKVVDNIQDPVIKAFWANEFARYTQRLESEALAAIQNKIGQLVSNPLIRNVLGQGHSTINMRDIMDKKKILIVNLSKGRIGEDNSKLLGAMMITRLQLAAMSRIDLPEEDRPDFFLYVDEFQNFATESFANILSEARKYHLSLILAHQYIGQLVDQDSTKVRDAVFGNVGTIATFRVGGPDAEFLEKEFEPEFMQNDLVNLPKANIYIKLMIDGIASRPFSAETMPPQKPPLTTYRDVIIDNSRRHYGTPRKTVEEKIASEWNEDAGQMMEKKFELREERPIAAALSGMMRSARHENIDASGRPAGPAAARHPPAQGMNVPARFLDVRRDTPPQSPRVFSPVSSVRAESETNRRTLSHVDPRIASDPASQLGSKGPKNTPARPREIYTPARSTAEPPLIHARESSADTVPIRDVRREPGERPVSSEPRQENAKVTDVILKRNPPRLPSSERFAHLSVDTDALKRAIAASLAGIKRTSAPVASSKEKDSEGMKPKTHAHALSGKNEKLEENLLERAIAGSSIKDNPQREIPKPPQLHSKLENVASKKEEDKNAA